MSLVTLRSSCSRVGVVLTSSLSVGEVVAVVVLVVVGVLVLSLTTSLATLAARRGDSASWNRKYLRKCFNDIFCLWCTWTAVRGCGGVLSIICSNHDSAWTGVGRRGVIFWSRHTGQWWWDGRHTRASGGWGVALGEPPAGLGVDVLVAVGDLKWKWKI